MSMHASNEYLRNAVLTAQPEQLQMMLYDGAIRFGRQAREALLKKDIETACEKLIRVQKIVTEMQNGLRPEINAELCEQLSRLYHFVYQRLLDANLHRDVKALDEALQILEHQRETWRLLLERIGTLVGSAPTVGANAPAQEDSLSIHG
ncbi:MAG: flagellar export chaperone FliS [Planctomycetes bacterium]|nr:flagellar export chaperone FliS [Planctomycetota bacterium]